MIIVIIIRGNFEKLLPPPVGVWISAGLGLWVNVLKFN